ncbi:DNA alkylation repair protein [Paludifilum halophilum]|uniref:DNA alkylation repair protein n=1 Tax=Paludifilum halophilum TaxID=1642702 RepID=A0A235B8W1_9BACL|nr:DNA alkylation repair protein [Paludifilum halophilum]OYD08317.1 DNA alkylation repair protein [Paludifilum halophilum]
MDQPYLCPTCGTNRSRFNLIEQVVRSVKKDPVSGEITERVSASDPLQAPYRGDRYRVQCGVCGVIEPEERFIKTAQQNAEQNPI